MCQVGYLITWWSLVFMNFLNSNPEKAKILLKWNIQNKHERNSIIVLITFFWNFYDITNWMWYQYITNVVQKNARKSAIKRFNDKISFLTKKGMPSFHLKFFGHSKTLFTMSLPEFYVPAFNWVDKSLTFQLRLNTINLWFDKRRIISLHSLSTLHFSHFSSTIIFCIHGSSCKIVQKLACLMTCCKFLINQSSHSRENSDLNSCRAFSFDF